MDKVPQDPSARHAFLERWAIEQEAQLFEQEKQLYRAEVARALAQGREIARAATQAQPRTGQVESPGRLALIPVVITKPSVLPVDRAPVFADLIAGLHEHRWADPIVSECDEPRYVAPSAIDIARRRHPGARWLLYMEDDVILGPDFGLLPELLREADELFPDAGVVSFFSVHVDEPGWSVRAMADFAWLQCAAIRNSDYLGGFRAFIDYFMAQCDAKQWPSQRWLCQAPDQAVQTFLTTEYEAYAVWCPSLVQHAKVTSTFSVFMNQVLPSNRMSPSYQRAYGS